MLLNENKLISCWMMPALYERRHFVSHELSESSTKSCALMVFCSRVGVWLIGLEDLYSKTMMEIDDKPEESTIVSPTGQGIRKSILGPKRDRSPTCHSPDSNSDSVALDHDSVNLGSEFKSPTSYNLSPLGKENEVLSVLLGPHQKIETCKERVVLSPRSQNWVTLAEQTIQTPRPMPSPAHTLSPDAKEWTPWQNDSCKKSTDSLQEQARSPKDGTAKIELVEDPWIPYCKTSLTPDVKSIGNLSALGKNVSRHSLQADKAEDNLPSVKGSLDSVYREFLHKEDAGTEPTLLKHLKERKHAIPSQVVKCLTAEELGLTDAAFKTQGSEFKGPLIGAWLPWQHKKSSVPDTDFEPSENQNSSKNHSSPKWQRSCAPTRPAEPQYPFHKEMNTSAENKAEDLKAYFAQLSSEQDTSSDISMPQKSVADESRTRRAYQLPSKVCIYDLRGEIAVLEQPSLHSHTPPTFRGWDQESTSTQPPFDPNYEHPYELRTGDAKKQKSSFRGFQTLIGEPHSSNPGRNHSHSRPNGFDPYFSSAEYISAEEYNQRPSAQIGEQASVRADKYNQPTSAYMPKFKPDETFGPPSGGFMQSHSAPNLQVLRHDKVFRLLCSSIFRFKLIYKT